MLKTASSPRRTGRGRRRTRAGIGIMALALWLGFAHGQTQEPGLSADIAAPRTEFFCYEPFTLTLSVRSVGVRLAKHIGMEGLPDASILHCGPFEELPIQQHLEGSALHEWRRYRCSARAMKPGPLTIQPTLQVGILTQRTGFFGPRWVETLYKLAVNPLQLVLLPLPAEGRPEPFSGGVGELTFEVQVSPVDVAVGDLVRLTLRIAGPGYLEQLIPPRAPDDPDFKSYDPRPLSAPGADERVYEQILIPQSTNAVEIPAIAFSYFDTSRRAYRHLTQGPFPLTFHPPRKDSYQHYRPPAGEAGNEAGGLESLRPNQPAPAGLSPADQNVFQRAQSAVDDGYYEAAIDLYEELLNAGRLYPEIYYNEANAHLLAGRPGAAVLNYRRAWRLRPRDAAVRANLALAVRQSGAAMPSDDLLLIRLTDRLSLGEWKFLAALAGIVAVAAAGLRFRMKRFRPVSTGLLAGAAASALFSLWVVVRGTYLCPPTAVVMTGTQARFAPATYADVTFALPEGSVVEMHEQSGRWVKVSQGTRRGWVSTAALTREPSEL